MTEVFELVLNSDIPPAWQDRVVLRPLKAAGLAVLRAEGWHGTAAVELLVVDDGEIRELNARHRGVDEATDVLSFPLAPAGADDGFVLPPEEQGQLGDIVISLPRAEAQAEEYGHSRERELAYLFVHGLLHLLGYDHASEGERAVMREKEEAALASVGLTR